MAFSASISCVLRRALAAALVLPTVLGAAVKPKRVVEPSTPWQMAEQAREQLLKIPAEQRTPRGLPHGDGRLPADLPRQSGGTRTLPNRSTTWGCCWKTKATCCISRRSCRLRSGQFEFLRVQYPRSSLRIAALLEEAHVAANGLRDAKLARAKYGEFVEEYPQSAHAGRGAGRAEAACARAHCLRRRLRRRAAVHGDHGLPCVDRLPRRMGFPGLPSSSRQRMPRLAVAASQSSSVGQTQAGCVPISANSTQG